jgi:AraC family transcriptional regulator of adaptative response / DNA-3-methyladenine glycosylase II
MVMNEEDIFYKAFLSRDSRFDGKFYVGVKTTKIYCRPICPARPKRQNVEFFLEALSAEKAGYRPCLRCHPPSSTPSSAYSGKSAVVSRVLRVLTNQGMGDKGEDYFAEQFGLSARHLRRLFREEIGLTPQKIWDNNRLNFALKLLAETKLSITRIALEAGFSSLRRFNDAFKKCYKQPPSSMRKKNLSHSSHENIILKLTYHPPLDWPHLINHFKNHFIPYIESISENSYERVFKIGNSIGTLSVEADSRYPYLKLQIACHDTKVLFEVANRVRKMFDLDSDPLLIANQFASHLPLSLLWKQWPGLRLANGWDPYETAICAILGQGITMKYASQLIGHLVLYYGEKIFHLVTQEERYLFPLPEILAKASLHEIKTTQIRKAAIRMLSQKILQQEISLSPAQAPEEFKKSLLGIQGIGPWTTEYISLRALADTDAFPATDLILKRALRLNPSLDLSCIRPWRGYAAVYLWKKYF